MSCLTVGEALFPEFAALHSDAAKAPIDGGVPYLGSKRKLLELIKGQIPDGVHHVADAFAGGCSVAYMLKSEGYQVTTNDSLRWSWHIARALVVNQRTTLSDDEIESLLQPNPAAGTFTRDTYAGKFWKDGVHQAIDEVRENIDALKGFKKDLALAALGAAMLTARGGFQLFTVQTVSERGDSPEEFRARVCDVIRRLGGLVMEGESCRARCQDVRDFLPKVQADLVYLDPPYVTEFSAHNYSEDYHAIEAVMVKGKGRNPEMDSATRREKTQADLTGSTITPFLAEVLASAEHIPSWLLSYRDTTHPTEDEINELFKAAGREVAQVETAHAYTMAGGAKDGAASQARELLFLGHVKEDATAKPKEDDLMDPKKEALAATQRLTATLNLQRLVAVAEDKPVESEDHAIAFILCHVGSNLNSDHFALDELKKAVPSAVGMKIDLKHGQNVQDIVGKTESAVFEDVEGGRVVCGGKLFTGSDELAAKARKLIHEELISMVSMECSYREGECSICGHKYTSAADLCDHLKNSKGQTLDGKRVYNIMHDIEFTGAALLEGHEPADPKASITSMAQGKDGRLRAVSYAYASDAGKGPETVRQVMIQQKIGNDLWDAFDAFRTVTHNLVSQFAAEAATLEETSTKIRKAATDTADGVIKILTIISKETVNMDPTKTDVAASKKALKDMTQAELLVFAQELEAKNTELEGKVQATADEKVKQDAKAAAETLVDLMAQKGRSFADAAARQAEVERLAGLSEEARKAVEDTWSAMPDVDVSAASSASAATVGGGLVAQASKAPIVGGDPEPTTLAEGLKSGLKAAYDERLKRERGEA